jgi:tetratricopeptide (TPR) repeat protein
MMPEASRPNTSRELLAHAAQARKENRPEDAERLLTEAVALCRSGGAPGEMATALCALGQIERDLRSRDAALEHYEEAAAIYRAERDTLRLAHTLRHLGDTYREDGRAELAGRCYREALDIYRAHSAETSPLELANAIRGFAILQGNTGKAAEAANLWREAGELYAAQNVEAGVAECRRRIDIIEQKLSNA